MMETRPVSSLSSPATPSQVSSPSGPPGTQGISEGWQVYPAPSRVASVSGSLWYPGFTDYIRNNAPKSGCGEKSGLEKAYFSLGDRESRTRHPLMSRVDACTVEVVERFKSYGIETAFEWNPGNHFDHPELRMARALAWLLR